MTLFVALSACSDSVAPAPERLKPHFGYTIGPVDSEFVFFSGDLSLWHAGPYQQSGYFVLVLGAPYQNGTRNFGNPQLTFGASGPRFTSMHAPDTIRVGAVPTDTILAQTMTTPTTWFVDSGRVIIRQIVDSMLVGDLDLWLSQLPHPSPPIRMTGTYIAGPY
jgi:hypothetical protein